MDAKERLRNLYNSKSFKRRVKRHVKAKLLNIDVIVTPQWKHLCRKEIIRLGYHCRDIAPSVLRINGKIGDIYKLALWLRTASRVCVTLPSFRAASVEGFRKKVRKIPWDVWVNPTIPLHFYTNVEYSRLRHEGMVKNIIIDEISGYFNELGFSISLSGDDFDEKRELLSPRQRIWINLVRNFCEIRLDMVGANLHQRGYRFYPGRAPVRETLAAAILEASEWNEGENLIDAMTGSGTFAIEAALKARKIPPGYFRSFLFEQLPSFRERMWQYEKRQAEKNFSADLVSQIVAVDNNPDMIKIAKLNAESIGVGDDIKWIVGDFFEYLPTDFKCTPGLLVMNPPYGKRLKSSTRMLYTKIADHINRNFRGWKIAVIVPHASLLSYFHDIKRTLLHLPHGGLWVYVVIGKIE